MLAFVRSLIPSLYHALSGERFIMSLFGKHRVHPSTRTSPDSIRTIPPIPYPNRLRTEQQRATRQQGQHQQQQQRTFRFARYAVFVVSYEQPTYSLVFSPFARHTQRRGRRSEPDPGRSAQAPRLRGVRLSFLARVHGGILRLDHGGL